MHRPWISRDCLCHWLWGLTDERVLRLFSSHLVWLFELRVELPPVVLVLQTNFCSLPQLLGRRFLTTMRPIPPLLLVLQVGVVLDLGHWLPDRLLDLCRLPHRMLLASCCRRLDFEGVHFQVVAKGHLRPHLLLLLVGRPLLEVRTDQYPDAGVCRVLGAHQPAPCADVLPQCLQVFPQIAVDIPSCGASCALILSLRLCIQDTAGWVHDCRCLVSICAMSWRWVALSLAAQHTLW